MVAAVAPTNDTEKLAIDLERALYRVGWLGQQQLAERLLPFRLTVAQYHTLCHLLDAPEGGVRMSHLARATGHTLATMTGIVDRLHARGLVERRGDPDDRRLVLIRLHPDGEVLALRARDTRRAGLGRVLDKLRTTDRLDLLTNLGRFADASGLPVA